MSSQSPARGGRGAGGRGGSDGGRGRGGVDRGGGRGARGGGSDRGGHDRGGGFDHGRGSSRGGRGGGRGGSSATPVEVFRSPGGTVPQPNAEVRKIEDDFIKQSSGIGALGSLSLTGEFPRRPGHGTQGAPVTVYANYFEITPAPNLFFYRYHVDIKPEGGAPVPSKLKEKRLIALLLELSAFSEVLTDFRSTLLSRSRLENVPGDVVIPFRAQGEDEPRSNPANYRITVQETGTVLVSQLLDYLKSTREEPMFMQRLEVVQALNTVLGHYPQSRSDIATIGQNRHFSLDRNPANFKVLGGVIEALRGYFKSVRPATARLLLNVNVSHAVCIQPLPLDQMMRNFGPASKASLAKQLKLLRVERLHLPRKKNKAGEIIPSIATLWDLANTNDGHNQENRPMVLAYGAGPKNVKFFLAAGGPGSAPKPAGKGKMAASKTLEGGKYISVWDYFTQNYPAIKMNPDLPVVNVGNRQNPCYLPAEACRIIPGQPLRRKLTADETRAMIEFACRRPKANAESITSDGRVVLGLTPERSGVLMKYGLKVGPSIITVPARVLWPPQIKYSHSKTADPIFGSWNMGKVQFHSGTSIRKWTYVWFKSTRGRETPESLERTVIAFRQFMITTGVDIGQRIANPGPPIINLQDGPGSEPVNNGRIADILTRMGNAGANKPDFLLVVLPYVDSAMYRKIKTVADTKAGIHTVCVVITKFMKEQRQEQYFANVALKFNLKAGGINHALDAPKLGIISEGKTMVVGIDVTHPSPQSRKGAPSVAGIVASVDKFLGQWPADLRIQESRKEMVSDLGAMFKSRLLLWQKRNKGVLPENILIYRDGVSESQYQAVLDEELPLLRAACEELYREQPKLSIIIVGKRHHTRFYPTKVEDADRSANCKNGTIVDRGVTEVRFWQFFLQAHACLQGTARPAHYYVIFDEIFRGRKPKNPNHRNAADALEDLTHNMSHLFGRATKAVSICPPAYYADLVCERARCYLGHIFDPTTPAETPAASVAGSEGDFAMDADVLIHPALTNSMFYI